MISLSINLRDRSGGVRKCVTNQVTNNVLHKELTVLSASEEISCLLWNLKFHCCVQRTCCRSVSWCRRTQSTLQINLPRYTFRCVPAWAKYTLWILQRLSVCLLIALFSLGTGQPPGFLRGWGLSAVLKCEGSSPPLGTSTQSFASVGLSLQYFATFSFCYFGALPTERAASRCAVPPWHRSVGNLCALLHPWLDQSVLGSVPGLRPRGLTTPGAGAPWRKQQVLPSTPAFRLVFYSLGL